MGPNIILIGPPGAGKSSIGKQLSKALQVSFTDTDERIENSAGKKISDIFLEDGEASFREIEKRIVLMEISRQNGILSLGGGAILDQDVANTLESVKGRVIYLEVSISSAAPRVGFNKERPLLSINPRQQWIALMEKRKPIYERVSGFKVVTDSKKPGEVVKEIRELMGI
jgi:shikimate kinase